MQGDRRVVRMGIGCKNNQLVVRHGAEVEMLIGNDQSTAAGSSLSTPPAKVQIGSDRSMLGSEADDIF